MKTKFSHKHENYLTVDWVLKKASFFRQLLFFLNEIKVVEASVCSLQKP